MRRQLGIRRAHFVVLMLALLVLAAVGAVLRPLPRTRDLVAASGLAPAR